MKNFKKLYWILAIGLAVSLGFTSCSKDDDNGDDNNIVDNNDDNNSSNNNNGGKTTTTYKMTAKVNGEDFSADVSGNLVAGKILLSAVAENFTPAIRMNFPASVEVGETYSLISDDGYAQYMNKDGMQTLAITGSVTITEYNKTSKIIKGTFSFSTETGLYAPSYVVTEGSFNCLYYVID